MRELHELIGVEHDLDAVSGALCSAVQGLDAPVVGAHEVNCSDESELECMAAFQKQFVERLLPNLKPAERAPFRTCNLGARYEWGSVRVAEHHYALPATRDAFKVLLVKINGHVSVSDGPDGPQYGPMARYETASSACGALHALLRGDDLPALRELRDLFIAGGNDRLALLLDPQRVEPTYRYLFAAVAGAVLQARRACEDICQHTPHSPTYYVVVPCLTLNRPGPDTEVLCGLHVVDRRDVSGPDEYRGLGDDPSRYRVRLHAGRLHITESDSAS